LQQIIWENINAEKPIWDTKMRQNGDPRWK